MRFIEIFHIYRFGISWQNNKDTRTLIKSAKNAVYPNMTLYTKFCPPKRKIDQIVAIRQKIPR